MITSATTPDKYRTTFTDGKHESIADAPVEMGGKADGFKPPQLMEAALGTCIAIVLRVAADARGIPVDGIETKVSMNQQDPQQTVFEYHVDIKGDITPEQRETLMHAVAGCPVKKILNGGIAFKEV
jgi:putative redox protein